jgi:peptide/nickel transport system ATP-binding protein
MGSIPTLSQEAERLVQIPGAMPRLGAIPTGCAFNPRCERAFDKCHSEQPELTQVGTHEVSCWLFNEAEMKGANP